MDRDTLLKTIKYIVNRYERYGTCEVGLDIVADSIDDLEVFHLYRTLEIDTSNGNVKTGMYAGEFLEEGKPYNTYYKSSDIDLRKYLSVLVNDYQSLNKEFKYLPIFLRELYMLSLEKEYITSTDVSYILSSISNDRKLKRTRK